MLSSSGSVQRYILSSLLQKKIADLNYFHHNTAANVACDTFMYLPTYFNVLLICYFMHFSYMSTKLIF